MGSSSSLTSFPLLPPPSTTISRTITMTSIESKIIPTQIIPTTIIPTVATVTPNSNSSTWAILPTTNEKLSAFNNKSFPKFDQLSLDENIIVDNDDIIDDDSGLVDQDLGVGVVEH